MRPVSEASATTIWNSAASCVSSCSSRSSSRNSNRNSNSNSNSHRSRSSSLVVVLSARHDSAQYVVANRNRKRQGRVEHEHEHEHENVALGNSNNNNNNNSDHHQAHLLFRGQPNGGHGPTELRIVSLRQTPRNGPEPTPSWNNRRNKRNEFGRTNTNTDTNTRRPGPLEGLPRMDGTGPAAGRGILQL
eukprot:jgi/Psemu1/33325/gm1.33325_g